MSDIVEQVKVLASKAERFDNIVDEIMVLKQDIADIENNDLSTARLLHILNNLIEKYESSSTVFLANIKKLGYQEGNLKKYVDSTFNEERIITVKAKIEGQVYVSTESGYYFVGIFSNECNCTQSLDYIMCDIQDAPGLHLLK